MKQQYTVVDLAAGKRGNYLGLSFIAPALWDQPKLIKTLSFEHFFLVSICD